MATAMTAPLAVPAVLILISQWKYPPHIVRRATLGLFALLLAFNAILLAIFGITELSSTLVGALQPAICWAAFFLMCRFRDGRLVFTVVTGMLLTSIDETLAYVFFPLGATGSLIIRPAIALLQSLALYFFCRKPFLRMLEVSDGGWIRLSMLPFTMLITLLAAYVLPVSIAFARPNPVPALLICISAVLVYVALYHFLIMQEERQRYSQGSALLNLQIREMERMAAQVQLADQGMRTFRHDLRHYISMLHACTASGDWDTLRSILDSMNATSEEIAEHYPIRRYTGNAMIDTVLSLAASRAEAAGVDCDIRFALPRRLEVDVAELAVILSNALENAINACKKIPQGRPKALIMYTATRTGRFFISVRNTYAGYVLLDPGSGLPLTSQVGHGYGTQSIAAFAKKHDAVLHFNTKDGWFSLGILI